MITLPLSALIPALSAAVAIIDARLSTPALSCVRIAPGADTLTLTTTDTITTLIQSIPATCATAPPFLVDAKALLAAAKSLPGGTVHLEPKPNQLRITCGPAVQSLRVAPVDDFPPIPAASKSTPFTLTGPTLSRLIAETAFCASGDDNRYGLNGIHAETVQGPDGADRLRFVTTDGSRLAYSEAPFSGAADIPKKHLLPVKPLIEVRKLAESAPGDWQISITNRAIRFTCGPVTLISRLVEGEFPDYRQVLPAAFKRTVTVDPGRLAQALKAARVIATDKNNLARFNFEPDRLTVSATNAEGDSVSYEVPIELSGKPLLTGFNVTFFQDLIPVARGANLTLQIGEALDPCIALVTDRDDCLFVVMPMRLE